MSWTPLDPIVRTVPNAKASITVTSLGPKLTISFSEPFFREVGAPLKCDVQGGAGENAGKVRLAFSKTGKFTIVEFGKGGARVAAPVFSGIPDGAREAEPCRIDAHDKTQAIIALPLAAWQAQLNRPAPVAAVPPKQTAPAAANGSSAQHSGPASKLIKRLNIKNYLEGRGHSVARRNDGQFVIDGQVVSRAKAVAIANEHRSKASLPMLGLEEVE